MIEVDFSRVDVGVADVPFYASDGKPVRIPPNLAVKCLDPQRCTVCGEASAPRTGLTAWLTERKGERSPTQWVTLCDEHLASTERPLPAGLPR